MTERHAALHRRQVIGGMLAAPLSSSASSQQTPLAGKRKVQQWLDLAKDSAVSVLDFIPRELHASITQEDCRSDLAPHINAAIRAVLEMPGGGTLFFPRGAYPVSEIDATNADAAQFSKTLRILGEGRHISSIRPAVDGAVLLNAAGRNNMTVQSIQFHSAAFASQTAIYLCRTIESPNCNNNRFFDVLVSGNYAVAGVVSIAAESSSWIACRFENASLPAMHRCFITSNRPDAAPVRPRLKIVPQTSSNTDNVMIDCEFYAPYQNAAPLLFAGSAAYSMQGCTVITGGASNTRLVTYRAEDDVFGGPVTWTAPHFEVFGADNTVHFLDAPVGVSYFRSIHSFGGNYVVGSATNVLSYDRTGPRQPVLMASTWTVPAVPWDARDLRFELFGLSESAIEFRLGDDVGTLDVNGYVANSRVSAGRSLIARTVTSPVQ